MKIIWTETAEKNNRLNLTYLLENFGKKSVQRFISKTKNTISVIESNPKARSWDKEFGFYKILFVKQIYLFYRIEEDKIYLLNFWNNSQKPYWN